MQLFAVGIAEVGTEITRPVTLSEPRHSLIGRAVLQGSSIRLLNCVDRRGEEGEHGPIPVRARLSIERHVGVKTRQVRARLIPA